MNYPTPPQVVNPALGSDLSGVRDLTPQMAEVSGRQCLAEGLARRISTPRGALIDDLDYGFDVSERINDDLGPADVAAIQSGVATEWQKDERVVSAVVTAQFVGPSQVQAALSGTVANPQPVPGGVLVIAGTVADSQGPFQFTVAVSSLSVQLLTVSS